MTKDYIKHTTVVPLGLLTTVLLSGLVLSSSIVSADNDSVVDQVNITVPVSCTMTGTGMDSHNAEIQNGLYKDKIGTTTLHAFCNDNEGFAIYAAGYTGNEIGGTNSNKLVGTNASSNATIVSGIATTAGSPDISNWAMKLAISQDSGDTTTNAFAIDSAPNVDLPSEAEQSATSASFSSYHVVPNEYVKVAHKNSMTDMTATTGGVKLTTTYAAYISKTQPADTYSGQVIYTLVHPASHDVPVVPAKISVNYHADGSTFPDGAAENQVVYVAQPTYIASTPLISKTDNIDDEGNQHGPLPAIQSDHDGLPVKLIPIAAPGASKMKVVVRYGFSAAAMAVFEGNYNYDDFEQVLAGRFEIISMGAPASGTSTYVFDGDAVTFYLATEEIGDSYDYGYFAQVYPIYTTEQTDTEPTMGFATVGIDQGTYAETNDWYGSWYADINGEHHSFTNEAELTSFLSKNPATLDGTTIDVYRGLSFDEAYARANKSQSGGYYIQQDMSSSICNTVAITQTQTLKDIRDNKTYVIGKMKDGKCWMLQNLDLNLDSNRTYTNLDTDLGWNAQTNSYETASWIPMRSTYETSPTNTHEWCQGGEIENGWCNHNNTPESYDPGDLYWNGEIGDGSDWDTYQDSCDKTTNPWTCDESLNPIGTYTTVTGTPIPQYHLGNYYNWPAAIASNNATYGEYNDETDENEWITATQSICPAGWTLPDVSVDLKAYKVWGGFIDLWRAYGAIYNIEGGLFSDISILLGDPLYSVPAGGFRMIFDNSFGYRGRYWLSSSEGSGRADAGYFSASEGYIELSNTNGYYGYPVRCVAR